MLVLRPVNGVIEPAAVEPSGYFSPGEIERARGYRDPQLWLYLGTIAAQAGVLAWLVARPPRLLRRRFGRPLPATAAVAAAVSLALALAPLPLQAIMRERARDVGLLTQSWGGYAQDLIKSWAIGAVLAAAGAVLAIVLMRRLPRSWWLPGAAVLAAFGAITVYAGPVLVDPLFNRFRDAPATERADVRELARRAGVDVGSVLEVDGSRRSVAANAYVTGIGHTKRVVLYDTLIDNFDRPQRRAVVAHELGHVAHHDIRTGLIFLIVVAPAAMFAVARLTPALDPGSVPGPQTVPALAAALVLVATPIGVVSNQLSRALEARADSSALRLTGDPDAAIALHRDLALRNLADPDPPGWARFLFATHPSTAQRIGIAEAYRSGAR